MTLLDDLKKSVISGNAQAVDAQVRQALNEGVAPGEILNEGLIPAMDEVGRLFESQEFYVPEMLIAARAMQTGMEILRPLLVESGIKPIGRVILGTVQGDLHDIGKNLVGMMLEGTGIEVVDLGVDVSPELFVEAAREGAQLVGLSALLTTTMANMKDVLEALQEAGIRGQIKVMVGGAPVTQAFADEIGADGYAADASAAATLAKSLIG
jgi:5-methyltetrahydrofolate--homocysteine methyltransferase